MGNIEEEIRQKSPFRNSYHRSIVNLMYMSSWITTSIREFLKPYNLTPQQYNVLRILRGAQKPISTLEIKDRLLDRNSDASRLIDRMTKRGLTEKCTSESDRRRLDVTITKKGLVTLDHIEDNVDKMDRIMHALTDEEAEQLSNLLDKARRE